MCSKPPDAPRAYSPPPVKAPEIQLGNENSSTDARRLKRRGRNQLRTDLGLSLERTGSGLTIP